MKKNMKKIFALMLVSAMVLACGACGSSDASGKSESTAANTKAGYPDELDIGEIHNIYANCSWN